MKYLVIGRICGNTKIIRECSSEASALRILEKYTRNYPSIWRFKMEVV
jgi:hypothetical protein